MCRAPRPEPRRVGCQPPRGGCWIDGIGKSEGRWMELVMGLEPMASSLPRRCSTTELHQQGATPDGAGEGNRTLVCSLEGCRSAIELRPRSGEPARGSGRDAVEPWLVGK